MSDWFGANMAGSRRKSSREEALPDDYRAETVEAALNRLAKTFQAAMECVAAWRRAAAHASTRTLTEEEFATTMSRLAQVGVTARQSLEVVVLDPLIAPFLRATGCALAVNRAYDTPKHQTLPPKLTSSSHLTMVRSLAYLSLINYSDLILAGLPRATSSGKLEDSILDRGVVQSLAVFSSAASPRCWKEDHEDSILRSLNALLDATDLDGSDPMTWLRLASAARFLGRVTSGSGLPTCFLKHRRLERHALECAVLSLPDTVPPNRLAAKALKEWHAEQEEMNRVCYPTVQRRPERPNQLSVDISRYSWSLLGRLLIRCCREGRTGHHHHRSFQTSISDTTWVQLVLSPILVLPSTALARICYYLDESQTRAFEATCRSLSFSILSARATTMLVERMKSRDSIETFQHGSERDGESEVPCLQQSQASRASKRLQTQLHTSGRRMERANRRRSTEFCLLAATLGLTPQSKGYRDAKLSSAWESWRSETESSGSSTDMDFSQRSEPPGAARRGSGVGENRKWSSSEKLLRQQEEARERLGDSSLWFFIRRFGGLTFDSLFTPLELLFSFVAHVSVHNGDVFMTDPGGSMVLSSTLLECIEIMLDRCNSKQVIIPSWSLGELPWPRKTGLDRRSLFAIDLLHAELRLRRCENEEAVSAPFDSDGEKVTALAACFEDLVEELDDEGRLTYNSGRAEWMRLKVRCSWFLSVFYLWRSRIARNVFESRETEEMGLQYIDRTIAHFLAGSTDKVPVPHLDSPTRSGPHWKVLSPASLLRYRNEIQASSVVLLAREQFVKAVSRIAINGRSPVLNEEDAHALTAIGESLLARYSAPVDSESKHIELADDFLVTHIETLSSKSMSSGEAHNESSLRHWFRYQLALESPVTSAFVVSLSKNASILSILCTCLQANGGRSLDVLLLFSRVIVAAVEFCRRSLRSANPRNGRVQVLHSEDSDSENDESSTSSHDGVLSNAGRESIVFDTMKMRLWTRLLLLLLERVRNIIMTENQDFELSDFVRSRLFLTLVRNTLALCSERFRVVRVRESDESAGEDDFAIFRELYAAVNYVRVKAENDEALLKVIDRLVVAGLVEILIRQRRYLEDLLKMATGRMNRNTVQKRVQRRAEFLAEVCCRLGWVLSSHHFVLVGRAIRPSAVLSSDDHDPANWDVVSPVVCECLVWLWNLADKDESNLKHLLLVPLATAITGYCGCAARTNFFAEPLAIDLTAFYDSDASARDFASDADCEAEVKHEGQEKSSRQRILLSMSQVVYCISNSFGEVADAEASSFIHCDEYMTDSGPTLPVVASRVLNHVSDVILTAFASDESSSDEGSPGRVWTEYAEGARVIGQTLDALLYKAYKCIHGFVLVNDGTDVFSAANRPGGKRFEPENVNAAIHLYRCIKRAYASGRRSPPKAALDMIVDSLPPIEENEKRLFIRRFLYSRDFSVELKDIISIVSKEPLWEDILYYKCGIGWSDLDACDSLEDEEDEYMIVRRGISHLLAQAPLLTVAQDNSNDRDERASSSQVEDEFLRRFKAIIDDISLGNAYNSSCWLKAAQCLIARSELVADRLGLSKGFSTCRNFIVTDRRGTIGHGLRISDLLSEQNHEAERDAVEWKGQLGRDLSLYSQFNWCSFPSLQAFQASFMSCQDDLEDIKTCNEIRSLEANDKLAEWQIAWGGLFVTSLREIARRCLVFALCVAYRYRSRATQQTEHALVAQITETLGSLLYSELSGSQVYGFPMRPMPQLLKREIAGAAIVCFEKSIDSVSLVNDNDYRCSWGLKFMIGKCHEKIAFTFNREAFCSPPERRFEHYMAKSLQSYTESLREAMIAEKEGFIAEENGGSSHGSTEVLYRLHATRLKCLISAVDRWEEEIDRAEAESLRLTECHWFGQPTEEASNTRDRVWLVLTDVVAALVHCRNKYSCFHRSVYRHAQALLWAPVLDNPRGDRRVPCLNAVPAGRACCLRGMNSDDVAESAFVVISSLFERKRPQLVAVWVTSSSSDSPFQTLNAAIRKYDTLRGKYIAAFLEISSLCKKRDEIEALLRSAYASFRDEPSYFAASAESQGAKPKKSHGDDCLLVRNYRSIPSFFFLTSVKRQANGAFASAILHEMAKKVVAPGNDKASIDTFKEAFSCFRRLQCPADDLVKSRSWKFEHCGGSIAGNSANRSVKNVVEAVATAYCRTKCVFSALVDPSVDWSGESQLTSLLRNALTKGSEMFPNISATFFSKKQGSPKRKRKRVTPVESAETASSRKSYEVNLPEGLKAGSTFVVSVEEVGRPRKVRLTVPDQSARVMRFTLAVSSAAAKNITEGGEKNDETTEESATIKQL